MLLLLRSSALFICYVYLLHVHEADKAKWNTTIIWVNEFPHQHNVWAHLKRCLKEEIFKRAQHWLYPGSAIIYSTVGITRVAHSDTSVCQKMRATVSISQVGVSEDTCGGMLMEVHGRSQDTPWPKWSKLWIYISLVHFLCLCAKILKVPGVVLTYHTQILQETCNANEDLAAAWLSFFLIHKIRFCLEVAGNSKACNKISDWSNIVC